MRGKQAIPPILFRPSSISPFSRRLEPAVAAAITLRSVAPPRHRGCDGNQLRGCTSQSHPPCSQLDIHLAAAVACDAGALLPHRFSHHPHPALPRETGEGKGGGWFPFCCSCRHAPSAFPSPALRGRVEWGARALTCRFVRQPCPAFPRDRESGSSSRSSGEERATDCLLAAASEPPGNRTLNPQLNLPH